MRRATFQQAHCVWMPDSNLYVQLSLIVTLIQGDLHSSASYGFPLWVSESGEPLTRYQSKPMAPVRASHSLRRATCPTPKYQNTSFPLGFCGQKGINVSSVSLTDACQSQGNYEDALKDSPCHHVSQSPFWSEHTQPLCVCGVINLMMWLCDS